LAPHLKLTVRRSRAGDFFPILQRGVEVEVPAGLNIGEVLTNVLGLSPEYVRSRVTTIFLDGEPVDDLETARVGDGATLAISSSMPGLVGATMRSGGTLAPFRAAISHREDDRGSDEGQCRLRLKIFNLLIREVGPGALALGVYLPAAILADAIDSLEDSFWDDCLGALLDNDPVGTDPSLAGRIRREEGEAVLQVEFVEGE
jgi:hypothetical protein